MCCKYLKYIDTTVESIPGLHKMFTRKCRPPEIPPDTPETNPILRTEELLDYKSVGSELCQTAVAKLALEHESGIWKIEKAISGLRKLRQKFIMESSPSQ